jgi:hypothetical protein
VLTKIVQRFLKKFGVKGDLFPNGDWRRVMIDAKCQQLHNGDYRFDDAINGGNNGVFGFSGDWRRIGGIGLDFLPWQVQRIKARKALLGSLSGLYCSCCQRLSGTVRWFFSVWADA